MASLEVDLVAADHTVWAGKAYQVSAPAIDGEIGIRVGHSPVLAVLRPGTVRVTPDGGGERITLRVSGGFLSVDSDQVTIVAEGIADVVAPAGR